MKLMGFGSFGSTHKSNNHGADKVSKIRKEEEMKKKAMQFDVDSMFASAAASAQQRNMMANQRLEEAGRAELEGFIVPKKVEAAKAKENEVNEDDDDNDSEIVGPMPPPMNPPKKVKVPKKYQNDDSDE